MPTVAGAIRVKCMVLKNGIRFIAGSQPHVNETLYSSDNAVYMYVFYHEFFLQR